MSPLLNGTLEQIFNLFICWRNSYPLSSLKRVYSRLASHYNMNALPMHIAVLLWAIAVSGNLAELQPILRVNQTSDNNSAELRQYTCGTTSPVYVTKGYQVDSNMKFCQPINKVFKVK